MLELVRKKVLVFDNSLKIINDRDHNGWGGGYFGQVDDQGVPHGLGRWCWHGSTIYEGQWDNGKFQGVGREIYDNASFYVGEFKKWFREGKGVYTK